MGVRAQRQEQVRRRILDAMKTAISTQSYTAIRVADIATQAKVSSPTVHFHFDTKEALFLEALTDMARDALALRGDPAPGDLPEIVFGSVRSYEEYGDANWRLVVLEHDSPAVAAALEQGRAGHRLWLESVFEPLLPPAGAGRECVVDALYAATDVGTWKLLRRDLGLSPSRTAAVMQALARGALHEPGGPQA